MDWPYNRVTKATEYQSLEGVYDTTFRSGDYSDIVLLPGDPLRAKWIADTYLDEVKQVNSVRNMLGFTGVLNWNDSKRLVSVQGGGMGMKPNAFIYMNLYNIYDVETIIRVGSCGGIHKDLNVGDIVVSYNSSYR